MERQWYLNNTDPRVEVSLQAGDIASIESPNGLAWLVSFFGDRGDWHGVDFLNEGGDNKILLRAKEPHSAIWEVIEILEPLELEMVNPRKISNTRTYYTLRRIQR